MVKDTVNILVVDDLPDKRLALATILESLGVNIVLASSGREALRKLLDQDFAVILLDVNMPEMDGFETAALIRDHKRCARTPIIFITAFADEMLAAQGYSLGAVDYILSPVVPQILRTKVAVFVDLFRKTEQIRRHVEQRVALVREQTAREAAEEAKRASAFLAAASAVLASSLEASAIQKGLLDVVVPFLGDAGFLTLVDERGRRQSSLVWLDGDRKVNVDSEREPFSFPANLQEASLRVLQTGNPELLAQIDSWPAHGSASIPGFKLTTATLLPLRARNRILGVLGVARGPCPDPYSLTELKLANELAERTAIAIDHAYLYRDVQEADRRKAEFLAVLSHELRNPLAPIRNALQILRLVDSDDAYFCEARAILERQVGQLAGLVDDLLNVFRVNHHKIILHRESLDVVEVVRDIVDDHRQVLEAEDRRLVLELSPSPIWVSADRTRLAQVISNLLQNAIKFTNPGDEVVVRVGKDASQGRAHVSVRDTGIGIAPKLLPHIFDTFAQADQGMDRSRGGLGLGLALVRGLVELHGGKASAASDGPGHGAEVGFWLPLHAAPETPPSSTCMTSAVAAGLKILIVEDNQDTARSLATLLRRYGHQVETEHTGSSGLEAARRKRPAIVLCDLGLPELDGYEVARALRGDPETASMRLIAISGYGQQEDRERSLQAGFDLHLTKPVDPARLQEHLVQVHLANGR